MKSNLFPHALVTAMAMAVGSSAHAAVIAQYAFPLVSGVTSVPTTQTATTVETGITASTFGGGGTTGNAVLYSVGGNVSTTGSTSGSGNAYLDRTKTPTTASVNVAGDSGYYFAFTVTPDAGKKLNLTSLSFFYGDAQAESSSPLNLGLYTSVDSYAAQVGSTVSWLPSDTTNSVSTDYFKTSSGTQYATLDLSGVAFQNLTAATTFRIYGWDNFGAATGGQLRIDDVQLNGSVIPEPSATLLGGLGLLALLRRRR